MIVNRFAHGVVTLNYTRMALIVVVFPCVWPKEKIELWAKWLWVFPGVVAKDEKLKNFTEDRGFP